MPRKLPRWLTLRAPHDKSEQMGAYSGVKCEEHITMRTELKGLKQGVHRCQKINHCILHLLLREFGILPSYQKSSGRKVPTHFDMAVEAQNI